MKKESNSLPILRIFIIVISFVVSVRTIITIIDLLRRQDIIVVKTRELTGIEGKNDELRKQLTEIQSDQYAEKIARDKFGYVKDGETMVIMGKSEAQIEAEKIPNLPHWKQWWNLFF